MTYHPNEKDRATVEAMVSYGIPHEDIAAVLGIDDKTMRKYYRTEIDTATAKANSQVAQRLYKKCMGDDTQSIIFWLKTRAKWAETTKHEGPDGKALQFAPINVFVNGALSPDGLAPTSETTSSTDKLS